MYGWIAKLTTNEALLQRISRLTKWIPEMVMHAGLRWLALLLYWCAGESLREQIIGNMRDLLPERADRELKQTRYRYYENILLALYEILIESYRLPERGLKRFRSDGEVYLEEALRLGRGAIVYTPHYGNFFYAYWYLCQKYNCLTVATAGSEELRPLYLRFNALGCPGLDYDSTPPLTLLRKLKKHLQEGGVVFLLGDFYRPAFPLSRFFGRWTRTPDGASMLSIELESPIIPFSSWRDRDGLHQLHFEAPLHLASSYTRSTRAEATALLNRYMERIIRHKPEQWFYWFNAGERWESKHDQEQHEIQSQEPERKCKPVEGKQRHTHSA